MTSSPILRRLLLAFTSIVALTLGTAGSAAQAHASTPTTWTIYVGSQSPSGQIQGMNFTTPEISVNVGDTIHFVVRSMEPHTVSFPGNACPATGFDFSKTCMFARTDAPITSPSDFRSSGPLSTEASDLGPAVQSWDLRFDAPGDFNYVCYLHGVDVGGHFAGMAGVVHVRTSGAYPQTQAGIDAAYAAARSATIEHGNDLWAGARQAADAHHVFVGAGDMDAMVMAFVRQRVIIRRGESVTFDLGRNLAPVPHTVTIGDEPGSPFETAGDPVHYTGGNLSSGILLPPGLGAPSTFKVTFDKAGTYPYYCMLHDGMGMVGTVVVQ